MARIGKFFFFDGSENLATVFYYHVRSNGGVVESIGCVDNTSSFLEQSSFLLSPSGYKEDTVYTQKPIGATGNLTFTRGSDAWRTNVQGLVERIPYNLVQYSNDLSNVSWTKTSVTVTPDSTVAPNGTLTADLVTFTATNGYVLRTQRIAPSTQYTFSAYFKNNTFATGETVFFRLSDGVIAPAIATVNIVDKTASYNTNPSAWTNLSGVVEQVGNDWFRVSVTATSVNGGNGWIEVFTNGVAKSLYVWGFQVVEGAFPLEYFPTTDRLDVPRIDYSYGTCPALLLEPQRTNIALYSEQFDNAYWGKTNSTVTSNTTISPSGNQDADTFTDASASYADVYAPAISITPNATYTVSVFIKKTTGALSHYPGIGVLVSGSANRQDYSIINTTTGQVVRDTSSNINSVSYSTQSVNDYWRVIVTFTDNQLNNSLGFRMYPAISSNGTSISSAAQGSNVFWGAQIEAGAYPSSYIKTEATTVTRLADSFSRNNIYTNNLITSAGGTWYVELRNNIVYTRDAGNTGIFIGDDINATNSFRFRTFGGGVKTAIVKSIATTESTLYVTTTDIVKFAIKWNGSTADLFVNGVKQVSATPFTTTAMQFLMGNAADTPKYIQGMALYPAPLDDVDCELLTNPTSSGYSSFASMASSLGYILI